MPGLGFTTSLIVLMALPLVLTLARACPAETPPIKVAPELQNKAMSVLQTAMRECDQGFARIHAAEALIWTGHSEGIREYFLEQERAADSKRVNPIGIWRVLYRANANDPDEQQRYLKKILAVCVEPSAQGRGTAAETLGKLKYAGADQAKLILDLAEHGKEDLLISARWILANSGKAEDEAYLAESLQSKNPKDRFYAAYAFRHFKALQPSTLKAMQDLAEVETAEGQVRYFLLGTLYTHLPADQRESVKRELLQYVADGNTDQRYESCLALANWPTEDMIPIVVKLLDNTPPDERIGAAYLLLRMNQPRDAVDPNH